MTQAPWGTSFVEKRGRGLAWKMTSRSYRENSLATKARRMRRLMGQAHEALKRAEWEHSLVSRTAAEHEKTAASWGWAPQP